MLTNKLTGAASTDKTYIEDVFSTYLYTGNGSTQTINNGIDLAGKGGMVWIKNRAAGDNIVVDTANSASSSDLFLKTNATGAYSYGQNYVDYSNSGFSLETSSTGFNVSGTNYASWTFRKAPKFFDVVTYTGNGASNRQISHSLGQAPGMIIVKRTDSTAAWAVYHRSLSDSYNLILNTTAAQAMNGCFGIVANQTAANFEIGDDNLFQTNQSGATYVAYLFAHDTTTDGLIQCGSFTNSTTDINLGWEPQYVLTKKVSGTIGSYTDWWTVHDNMRGMSESGGGVLWPHLSDAESSQASSLKATATGFNTNGYFSYSSGTYIYMAIRRGPMRTPTDGTTVYKPVLNTGNSTDKSISAGFPPDMDLALTRTINSGMPIHSIFDKLRGANTHLWTASSNAEEIQSDSLISFDQNGVSLGADTGSRNVNSSGCTYVNNLFRRAPGFFDIVCYTGTGNGVYRTVPHNLGVAPDLIIIKMRDSTSWWPVYVRSLGSDRELSLNWSDLPGFGNNCWGNTHPTSSVFSVQSSGLNNLYAEYVAYIFGSCPGVSKVGSYTGNGTNQTINCGFTNGARFVLIKRTNVGSTGNWYVWDTARGIVANNDPYLSLNTTDAEVTTNDTIDPASTGFIVNQVAATNVNVSGGSYIYLAIA